MEKMLKLWQSTGLYHIEPGQLLMIAVCLGLIYLAIKKGFEPLLLIPIGFGGLLSNIPVANMAEGAGFLKEALENYSTISKDGEVLILQTIATWIAMS